MSHSKEQGHHSPILTPAELEVLKNAYDRNKDGKLTLEEVESIVADYKAHKHQQHLTKEVAAILAKFDKNSDGHLDEHDVNLMHKEFHFHDSAARYAGYTAGAARLFRYLAFTSDFGEALRPVVSRHIVNASYGVAVGYCFADVGWEAYKLKERGYKTEQGHPMSLTQLVVERSTFQALASVAIPFGIIHTTVDVTRRITQRMGRFTRWGPSIAGLAIIPALPLYLDEPVEHAIEWVFERYGPWAGKSKKQE